MTISPEQFARYARTATLFVSDLIVDVDGTPRRFGDVMDEWQRKDFAALAPGLKRAVGRGRKPGPNRAFLERGRGHSKTHDLAVLSVYALAFATRPIRTYAFAADRDQAGLLRDAMETLVRLNPWLAAILDVQAHSVVNIAEGHPAFGARLDILASDVGSSYGILADLIVADELVHWQGDGSLWHSLISSAAKRSNCFLCVISNAGFADSWQWSVREAARSDDAWYFSRLDGPQASWLSQARLAEQRRMLPPVAYNRLWGNEWSSGGGDALTPADIEAAFDDRLTEMVDPAQGTQHRDAGWVFVTGVDLGLTRDSTAVVTLAAVEGGRHSRIRLAGVRVWRPRQEGGKVDLSEVERYILDIDDRLGIEHVAIDPWQGELLGQRLELASEHRRRNEGRTKWEDPWVTMLPPTAANLRTQASLLIESFQDRRLQLFNCAALRRDLLKLRVEERSYGIRLVSPRDEHGHGDVASAFTLGLVKAHELAAEEVAGVSIAGSTTPTAYGGLDPLSMALIEDMRANPPRPDHPNDQFQEWLWRQSRGQRCDHPYL